MESLCGRFRPGQWQQCASITCMRLRAHANFYAHNSVGRDEYVLNDKSLLVITDQRKPETSAMSQHFSGRSKETDVDDLNATAPMKLQHAMKAESFTG